MEKQSELGNYLRQRREELGYGIRELCRIVEKKIRTTGNTVSSPYLSQVETGFMDAEKVSMDFLWAVGAVLQVDPLKLWVLARPAIDRRYLEADARDKLFRVR